MPAAVDAYFKPVVAFVREHFVGDDEGEVHESQVVPNTTQPNLRDGVNIIVEPRATLGELRVRHVGPPFYAPGTSWAETGYCLHVLQEGGITTIAIEWAWRWIK